MSDTTYCYHCGIHHPNDEMRTIVSKGRVRRRCKRSLEAAKQSQAIRDAYGRNITESNRRADGDKLRERIALKQKVSSAER